MIRSAFEAEFLMQEERLFSGSPNVTVALYVRRSVPIEQAYNSRGGAQHCRDDCYGWAGIRVWLENRPRLVARRSMLLVTLVEILLAHRPRAPTFVNP